VQTNRTTSAVEARLGVVGPDAGSNQRVVVVPNASHVPGEGTVRPNAEVAIGAVVLSGGSATCERVSMAMSKSSLVAKKSLRGGE